MSLFSCRDTVCLASESLDRDLPLRPRLALRVHLLMCRNCARFHRHLLFLHLAARRLADQAARGDVDQAGLSAEARDRMKRALEQNHS
jgi:Putative zinc-finger